MAQLSTAEKRKGAGSAKASALATSSGKRSNGRIGLPRRGVEERSQCPLSHPMEIEHFASDAICGLLR
ncbi:hypothetical protein TUM20286_58950 [Pseudomonas tohonis]|uniref:Uncharacterized protein n=1 Tax=Pseudomonas tohonis TaxID=2725477 RepID=A0ABQ4W9L1_9PSED|nr:hypothetical protein TUM20286_58950 [Pseudomonas tohonis]